MICLQRFIILEEWNIYFNKRLLDRYCLYIVQKPHSLFTMTISFLFCIFMRKELKKMGNKKEWKKRWWMKSEKKKMCKNDTKMKIKNKKLKTILSCSNYVPPLSLSHTCYSFLIWISNVFSLYLMLKVKTKNKFVIRGPSFFENKSSNLWLFVTARCKHF